MPRAGPSDCGGTRQRCLSGCSANRSCSPMCGTRSGPDRSTGGTGPESQPTLALRRRDRRCSRVQLGGPAPCPGRSGGRRSLQRRPPRVPAGRTDAHGRGRSVRAGGNGSGPMDPVRRTGSEGAALPASSDRAGRVVFVRLGQELPGHDPVSGVAVALAGSRRRHPRRRRRSARRFPRFRPGTDGSVGRRRQARLPAPLRAIGVRGVGPANGGVVSARAVLRPSAGGSNTWRGVVLVSGIVATPILVGGVLVVLTSGSEATGALLLGVFLVALSLPVLARAARREGDRKLFWILSLALVAKLLGSVANYYVAYGIYGGVADAAYYHDGGVRLAPVFQSGDFLAGFEGASGTDFIGAFTGFVYALVGTSALNGFVVFSWLAFWGMFLFYR